MLEILNYCRDKLPEDYYCEISIELKNTKKPNYMLKIYQGASDPIVMSGYNRREIVLQIDGFHRGLYRSK